MPHLESAPDRVFDSDGLYFGSPRALSAQGQRILCNTAARFFNAEADLLRGDALDDALAPLPGDLAE